MLDATFGHIEGQQYEGMDLKPHLRNDAQRLAPDQVKQERSAKAVVFASVKEVRQKKETESFHLCPEVMPSLSSRNVILPDPVGVQSPCPAFPPLSRLPVCPAISPVKLESFVLIRATTAVPELSLGSLWGPVSAEAGSSQFALWVAFFEIYNESVHDLLQPSLCSRSRKRASLRVCDDGAGNAYVKGVFLFCWAGGGGGGTAQTGPRCSVFADLRWVNIQNLGEAFKLLQYGNRNRSAAATKMNQSSSRRQVGLLFF